MSTKLRKKRVRIFVGLREYGVRSYPYIIDKRIKAGLQSEKQPLAAAKTAIGRPNENEHKASKEAGANFRRIARVRSMKQSVFNR